MNIQRFRLLSPGQRRTLGLIASLGTLMIANTVYLVCAGHFAGIGHDPENLPLIYQLMLVAHVTLGVITVLTAAGFAATHFGRMYRIRKPRSRNTGLGTVAALATLLASGFFILSEANSRDNEWIFVTHQATAALIVALYLAHRYLSSDPPARSSVALHSGAFLLVFIALWIVHGSQTHHTASSEPLVFSAPTTRAAVSATPVSLSSADLNASATPVSLTSAGPNASPTPASLQPAHANASTTPATLPPTYPIPPSIAAAPTAQPISMVFHAAGDPDPRSPLFPSNTTTTTGGYLPSRILTHDDLPDLKAFRTETQKRGFAPSYFLGAQSCARCHADIVKQWSQSAHRFASFNNPFYRKAVELTRETAGRKRSQFCGGCHDPAIMLAGNMEKTIDPLTPESQAGLTCLACHAIDRIHNKVGNGNYNIHDDTESPYLFDMAKGGLERVVHDYLLKAKPTVHKRRMLQPFFRDSEFCLSCHKVNLDVTVNDYHWLRGQNEYDNWQNSGFNHGNPNTWYEPPAVKQCQDCHMPLEPATLGDVSAKGGMVRSHRFVSVNTALPAIRGDQESVQRAERFMQEAKVRLDIFALHREDGTVVYPLDQHTPALKPGELVQVDIVIRNQGVGHTFPGGTNDSNEGWIDFQASLGTREIFHSGAVRPDRQVDPAAHFFQTIFVDRNGERIAKRNATDIYTTVYAHVIRPSTSDIARYRFRVPLDVPAGTLNINVALRWRKFNRTFTEFAFAGQPVPDLPITTIAQGSVALPVGDASPMTVSVPVSAPMPVSASASVPLSAPASAVATPTKPRIDEWVRYNDYGVGLFLSDDTRGALEMFKHVTQLQPLKVDGWLNQARAYLADGDLRNAESMLRQASAVAPDQPRIAFFWGQWLEKSGRLTEAVQAYRRALQSYPDSRDAWSRLGRTYWLLGQPTQSITAYQEVLRIDPEDAVSYHQLNLAYTALAASAINSTQARELAAAALEAEKGFEKYKLDENAQKVTQRYRQTHPYDNIMSQKIVIHSQEGVL